MERERETVAKIFCSSNIYVETHTHTHTVAKISCSSNVYGEKETHTHTYTLLLSMYVYLFYANPFILFITKTKI